MIYKGRIIGLFREKGSGLGMVAIDDEKRGKILVPCERNPTARAFDEAFGGFIINGITTDNSVIFGESVYFTVDDVGVLESFTPEDRAPVEMVEQYEAEKRKRSTPQYGGRGTCTNLGILPPDDRVYTRGPIVAGREIGKPGTHTRGGFLPDDHPLFGAGPIVAGRAILQSSKKKVHENN